MKECENSYIEAGQKRGLVTVKWRGEANVRSSVMWFCICECGKGRWFQANNLRRAAPKTHKFCHRGVEMPLDAVREMPYKSTS